MKINKINLFTQSSTSIDDLSDMDLKIKLLNRIHSNKSNETHTTHQQLYDTLYESITLDQDALDAQAAQSSFYKRSHDNQDPPNKHEGENKKKRQKDVDKPSSRSSRQNRSLVVIVQDDTPAMQPLDKANTLIQKHSNPEWFPKKSGLAKRRTTWFDLFLKIDINKDENHILGPSIITIEKNTEEKYTTSITKHYYVRYYKEGIEDKIPKRWRKQVRHYHFEALNGIHHWEEDRIDFFKAGMSAVTEGNVYSDLRIKSIVRIVVKKKWGYGFLTSIIVRRFDDQKYEFNYADFPTLNLNDVEDMHLLQVKDKLHHFPLEFVKDFNNALLIFIKIAVIKNRVEVIQLGVESYQRTLNLTEPTMFFDGIDQRIPFIATHKGVVYLNQYNIKYLMKFCDGSGNIRLKGRDWTDYDVKSSKEILKKIYEILKYREHLRRLEEYVGGRPRTVNLCFGKPKPTRMRLELADRHVKRLLNSIILGRPFLAAARAMIDVFNKKITLKVGDDEVIFDMEQSMKKPSSEDDECYSIDDLDETINEKI
ncbi:hypothetical protein Tco_1344410 [Tanacetum coccineum]